MKNAIIGLKAPFLSYRPFNVGSEYNYTLPTIPHSAAYGIGLNLAGIEMKDNGIKTGGIREAIDNLPKLQIAVGVHTKSCDSEIGKLLHQNHNYVKTASLAKSLGKTQKELDKIYGYRKYSIAPSNREYISNYHGFIALRSDDEDLIDSIINGIDNCIGSVPYAGRTNQFFSHIYQAGNDLVHWYSIADNGGSPLDLTTSIRDRKESTKTIVRRFFLSKEASIFPSENCWVSPYNGD